MCGKTNYVDVTRFRCRLNPTVGRNQKQISTGCGNNIYVGGNGNTVIVNKGNNYNNGCQNRQNFTQSKAMQYMMQMMSMMMMTFSQLLGLNQNNCNQDYGFDQYESPYCCSNGGWAY